MYTYEYLKNSNIAKIDTRSSFSDNTINDTDILLLNIHKVKNNTFIYI